jgi:hypothetical protein
VFVSNGSLERTRSTIARMSSWFALQKSGLPLKRLPIRIGQLLHSSLVAIRVHYTLSIFFAASSRMSVIAWICSVVSDPIFILSAIRRFSTARSTCCGL